MTTQYGMVGYSTSIGLNNFNDDGDSHSPIIGWAYDGNPIYGAYGYEDPTNVDSDFKVLDSVYELSVSDITRPSGFADGFFVEDYKFTASGDLDEHNGRYSKTPEYPNGVYVITSLSLLMVRILSSILLGSHLPSSSCGQDIDRHLISILQVLEEIPYHMLQVTNMLITLTSEPNEVVPQSAVIDSITQGSVDGFTINSDGSDYRVGDLASFDNNDTNGGGLGAYKQSYW